MKFLIVGAGAMGCLYGARLKKASQKVILIGHRKEQVEQIRTHGLYVTWEETEEQIPMEAYTAEELPETAQAEYILIFTKGSDLEAALASVQKVIGPETQLISFQNGIGYEKKMQKYTDLDHIVIGTSNFPSERPGMGKIISKGAGITRMMTASGKQTAALQKLYDIFKEAKLHPEIVPEIHTAIWEKVAFNAALNSLTAVTYLPQGYLGQTEQGRKLAHTIVTEVCMVAREKKISVNEEKVHQTVDHLLEAHFAHWPSMLQDVCHKRKTEIDFINGAVVEEAAELGIEVPVTKVLYDLVRILEQTYDHRIQ